MPLARPGGAGHDGKTSRYGTNHNDVCRELAQPAIDTKSCSFRNSLARCVQQAKHDPEVIFELRWPARMPLARPGGAGHDGKTPWYGSNHNGVCRELAQPAIDTKTCSSQLDRSLAVEQL
jgi:hypothetical protein